MMKESSMVPYQVEAVVEREGKAQLESRGFAKKVVHAAVACMLLGLGVVSIKTHNNLSPMLNLKASSSKSSASKTISKTSNNKAPKILSPAEAALREQELREKEAAAAEKAEESRIKRLPTSYVPARDYQDPCDVGRGTCCTDENYPVLGGMDVVQYKLNGEIVFGEPRYKATVSGMSRSYTFWFGDKAYASLFNLNPEVYVPKFGGFESSDFCTNGGGLETLVQTTLDISKPQGDYRSLYFANPSVDVSSCENIWNGYFGSPVTGIFNTRCVDFSHMGYAQGLVDFLPLDAIPVKQSTILGVPPQKIAASHSNVAAAPASPATTNTAPNVANSAAPADLTPFHFAMPKIDTSYVAASATPLAPSTPKAPTLAAPSNVISGVPPPSTTLENIKPSSPQDALVHASQVSSGPAVSASVAMTAKSVSGKDVALVKQTAGQTTESVALSSPAAPVTVPAAPVTIPAAPVTVPAAPVTVPAAPVTAPAAPYTAPAAPYAAPAAPATAPAVPVASPSTPVAAPATAVAAPATTVAAPAIAVAAPANAVAAPAVAAPANAVAAPAVAAHDVVPSIETAEIPAQAAQAAPAIPAAPASENKVAPAASTATDVEAPATPATDVEAPATPATPGHATYSVENHISPEEKAARLAMHESRQAVKLETKSALAERYSAPAQPATEAQPPVAQSAAQDVVPVSPLKDSVAPQLNSPAPAAGDYDTLMVNFGFK